MKLIVVKVGDAMTFGDMDYKNKLSYIEKYYKNDTLFFAAYLNNYNGFYIYIRIDYIDKLRCYKLRWFDLNFVKDNKISKYESSEYIDEDVITTIEKLCTILEVDQKNNYWGKENNVGIYIDSKCKNSDEVKIKFYKYVPECYEALYQILSIIFEMIPKKLYPFIEEIGYTFNGGTDTFEYEKKFIFDLFKGDLDKVFNIPTCVKGTRYYDEKKVLFLEKIDNKYFSVVKGNDYYLVIIEYDEVSKDVQVYCSCPCDDFCKHIYSVIMAIREKDFKSFYKIMPKRNGDMFDKLMNINYIYSIGIVDDKIGLIGNSGHIEWENILDEDNKLKWIIVEDDDKENLINEMTKFLDSCEK